jgi:hypothetical protein
MKNYITIGGKIGYLNLRTGKYKWVEIIGYDTLNEKNDCFLMREKIKQGKFHVFINQYKQPIDKVIEHLKTPSIDFSDKRMLLKYKGTNKLY